MKSIRKYLALLLAAALLAGAAAGCATALTAQAADLMSGISPEKVNVRPADDAFKSAMADFSVELFKKSVSGQDNSLISPLSVMLALAMAANGASGETRSQMEALLGGGAPLSELNEYLYSYAKNLPSEAKSKLDIANSIWFKDTKSLQVEPGFLQINADYYDAAAYKAPFDASTERAVNDWVKKSTDGMIDKILAPNEITDYCLILLNAITFEAEWQSVYFKENINKDTFTNAAGARSSVDFMNSRESLYLDDGMATGFIKPYNGGNYSFAALLPNEGVDIGDYIKSLTGAGFLKTLNGAQDAVVNASMPKFKYDYTITMNDALKALGIPDAFDVEKADFTKMATSADGNIYIDKVLHKTFISVDELGTKAGAVAMVAMAPGSAPLQIIKNVTLDRPFVFAIIDNATDLPVFIGAVMAV